MPLKSLCCIHKCPSAKLDEKNLHTTIFAFPKNDSKLYEAWMEAVTPHLKKQEFLQSHKICQFHFEESCIKSGAITILMDGKEVKRPRRRIVLNPGSVPTIFSNTEIKMEIEDSDSESTQPSHTEPQLTPIKCAIATCSNTFQVYDTQIRFCPFPRDESVRNEWISRCCIDDYQEDMMICSEHFMPGDYVKKKLKTKAVPSANLPEPAIKESDGENESSDLRLRYLTLKSQYKLLTQKVRRKIRVKNQLVKEGKQNPMNEEENELLSRVFSSAQIKLLLGVRKVRWSNDDLARAFLLRQMGNKKSYLFLKNTLNFPLPALSCVQRWAASG